MNDRLDDQWVNAHNAAIAHAIFKYWFLGLVPTMYEYAHHANGIYSEHTHNARP
jgi:hypothetical protein